MKHITFPRETSQQHADRLLQEDRARRARIAGTIRNPHAEHRLCCGCDDLRDEMRGDCPNCGEVTDSYVLGVLVA